ncbi:MAG: patatin-like phospholipase family protein [bacterium]|nr:patatin-like phospholipase family protein [bacterium]
MGKVGLVLCGGVAKGAYEVGVLRALAERNVIPDVIVGISAGAINGAFAARHISAGTFSGQAIEAELARYWRRSVTAQHLYHGYDRLDGGELERRNLRTLFKRIGVDPLSRRYVPRLGLDSLLAFEELIRGDFASLISHHFIRHLCEENLTYPGEVKREVKLSLVATDLMGCTRLSDEMELTTHYARYEDFTFDRSLNRELWDRTVPRMVRMIEASSSFPFLFPPTPDEATGGMLFDGGLWDNAPIGRAIRLDPEVDTVIVVSGCTTVERPETEPDTLYSILGRVFTMLSGRFVVQNYRKVMQQNRKLGHLETLLKRGKDGRVLANRFNQTLALAAGYKSLEDLTSRRIVNLVPIFPKPSLPGDVFAGFFDAGLRDLYIRQGHEDAVLALSRRPVTGIDAEVEASVAELEGAVLFSPPIDLDGSLADRTAS